MMSSLLPKQQQEEEKKKKKKKKKAVNHYEKGGGLRAALEEGERRKKTMMGCDGRGGMMRFFPEIYVKLTTCNFYLKNSRAKPRLKWEHQLQERFLQSIHALGGEQYATPKKILYMMNAVGLTLSHLKSHLQKYRISVKAPPRRSRINRKEKTNSVGHGEGSSSSTKKFEANKQNAESSEPRTANGCKPLMVQYMEMTMEITSKIVAPASAREKGKEPAIQAMGNKMIIESSSSFASSKGKETAIGTNSNGKESQTQNSQFIAIGAASSSSFATGKMAPAGFSLETKSHPLRPNNNNIDDIFQIGQSLFSENLAYSNSNHQYSAPPPPDSNSSFGKVGGSRSVPGNYQMNTSMQISSSLFHNTKEYENESGSNFSSLSANSNSINNAISFSPGAGIAIANSIGINSGFSGFPSMIEHPMGSDYSSSEFGSNFPSIYMMEQSWMGGFGWSIPSINANANPARLGSTSNSFFPMVALRPSGSSFSFPTLIANPTELDSRFPPMMISNSNPNGPGTNLSNSRVVMVNPTEPSWENPMLKLLDSSFLSILTNPILEPVPTEFGSIFSSRIANANPNRIGPGSLSSSTLNENPMPQPSDSSFSSVMDLGIRFHSTFDDSVEDSGSGTSLSLSYDNSINTDFSSSSVLENIMDLENRT